MLTQIPAALGKTVSFEPAKLTDKDSAKISIWCHGVRRDLNLLTVWSTLGLICSVTFGNLLAKYSEYITESRSPFILAYVANGC